MSDIQRFAHDCDCIRPMRPDPAGTYVTYGDHIDSIAASSARAVRAAELLWHERGCADERAKHPQVTMTNTDGVITVNVPPNGGDVLISIALLEQVVAALNKREADIRAAEKRGYTNGFNDRARAEQRTLIEYGGRPSKPDLCGKPCSYCFSGDQNPCTNQPGHEGPCDCNGVEPSDG